MREIVALDLFAGTGWGVGCKRLGIKEKGVELMAEAVATREANGMETIYRDVWDGLLLSRAEHARLYGIYTMLIGSPPCQTFSVAGGGAGRRALDEVIEAIQLHAYKDPAALLEFGKKHDLRTALVLSPLAYIYRDMPRLVVLEQVPTVLPVWEAYAEIMTDLGYDVKTAILNAEQYGVPQTRRRAILVARLDGPVSLPTPTHSRYYPRTPEKLDPGVLKWVSMAEALGWGRHTPAPTYCNSGHGGAGIEWGGNSVRKAMREQSVTKQGWTPKEGVEPGTNDAIRVSVDDAAAIQSYPVPLRPEVANWKWLHAPATTIAADPRITAREHHYHGEQNSTSLRLTVDEAHILQTYPTALRSNYGTGGDASKRGERSISQPAPTVTSKVDRNKWDGGRNVSVNEAAALQTYEEPFEWRGSKTKQYLQIGNAVPPLMAEAVLSAIIAEPKPRRRRISKKLV
jgi:DNA (cytosine-5)-methyltransferase 1